MQRYDVNRHGQEFHGVVTRPRASGSPQTLVFLTEEVHELQLNPAVSLGPKVQCTDGATGEPYEYQGYACYPVYEPTTDSVYYFEDGDLLRVDANNVVGQVVVTRHAGGNIKGRVRPCDCFEPYDMVTDGRGTLYVVDGDGGERECGLGLYKVVLRRDQAHSRHGSVGTVTATVSKVLAADGLTALCYDGSTDTLLAATSHAVYHVALQPEEGPSSSSSSGGGSAAMRLVAGSSAGAAGSCDGCCTSALFTGITAMVPGPDGATYILDRGRLRKMSAWGEVQTLAADLPIGEAQAIFSAERRMVLGVYDADLLVLSSEHFATSTAAVTPTASHMPPPGSLLMLPPSGSATVTLRVGGRSFVAHRSLLAARSDYFRQLLAGGFAEDGAEEVELRDADPWVFGALLDFMYFGRLEVPDDLLRPTAELAGRLLMPAALQLLQSRLLAAATPATVVAELEWAARHNLAELVEGLKQRLLRSKAIVSLRTPPEAVRQLAESCPKVMAELFMGVWLR
ncbi:hypothetical protein Agub_g15845 [Astrephomene gubernaculifera]|uniref:BTB domain-containing protein n=1 Tax=Astrephomene gubernaculifera TaxID=47775 RepID=A0AAD3E3V1_9CHLO|nr:hypothetical protein Agub_g15845 [Astrephomene gubernaculifera]